MTIIGLVLTGAIGCFVLDTLFWLLGWKGRVRPPRWEDDVRPKDYPPPSAELSSEFRTKNESRWTRRRNAGTLC